MVRSLRWDDEADVTADELLARIQALYHQLQALPERPDGRRSHAGASPMYLQLEAQIREYARQFRALTG
jgi:hypothetical protein